MNPTPDGSGIELPAGEATGHEGRALTLMARRRPAGNRRQRRHSLLVAIAFIAPAFIFYFAFIAGPLLAGVGFSFLDWDLLTPPKWGGLRNYVHIASDPVLLRALINTIIFSFVAIPLHVAVGLLLAVAVNRAMPGWLRYILRTLYFLPLLITYSAVALIWQSLLDPNFGFINYYVSKLGISPPNWLGSSTWAMPAIIVTDMWHSIGRDFIILLAGLQGIPNQYYEAARVDGASAPRTFIYVTVPLLFPIILFVFVTGMISAFQVFPPMFIMTQGGPNNSTISIVEAIYDTAFKSFNMGYAAVQGLLIFVIILIITVFQLRLTRKWFSQ